MSKELTKHKRYIVLGIIFISLGISFSSIMEDTYGFSGIVFIVLGGLFLIKGVRMKKKEDK